MNTRTLRGSERDDDNHSHPHPPRPGLARRLLGSPVVDLLLGPHGVDRYLELISPTLTVARRPRRGGGGPPPDGPQRHPDPARPTAPGPASRPASTSPSASRSTACGAPGPTPRPARRTDRRELELTVTEHPGGLVSGHLLRAARAGTIVHLAGAQGMFALPDPRPERIVLISGGSGITPVLSMLRTLADEGHDGEIVLPALRAHRGRLALRARGARAGGSPPRRCGSSTGPPEAPSAQPARRRTLLRALVGDASRRHRRGLRPARAGRRRARRCGRSSAATPSGCCAETFTPPRVLVTGDAAAGTAALPAQRSHRRRSARARCSSRPRPPGSLPSSAAGWASATPAPAARPPAPCATCAPARSQTRSDEDIQLCISAPGRRRRAGALSEPRPPERT